MEDSLTRDIIGAAIEVHRELGPGLLESIYEECLSCELASRGLRHARQKILPVRYKGRLMKMELRIDLLVEEQVAIELKAVEKILPVHAAQLLSYLRLSDISLGLLINFNVPVLKHGIQRIVHRHTDSASRRLCVDRLRGENCG